MRGFVPSSKIELAETIEKLIDIRTKSIAKLQAFDTSIPIVDPGVRIAFQGIIARKEKSYNDIIFYVQTKREILTK